MRQPIRAEASLSLPFSPEQLWPFVSDTDRVDRAVGLPAARFVRTEQEAGGEQAVGEYRLLGLPVARWIEHPFEWERPRRFSVVREYLAGPLRRFHGGAELEAGDGGTRLRVFAEFVPRHALVEPLLRLGLAPRSVERAARQYKAVGDYLAGRVASPFPVLAEARTPADAARLEELVARLRAEDAPEGPLERLRRWLAEAADEEVYGMRPLELAERWGMGRRETLETFLRATVAGLLEMRWELLCPACRGVKADAAHLRELASGAHCAACSVSFSASVDEAIEARFYPARGVRAVELGSYCVGGPMATPHRVAQMVLPPGEAREWRLGLKAGTYAIRSPQSRGSVRLLAVETGAVARLGVRVGAMGMAPDEAEVAAGEVLVHLVGDGSRPMVVALDDARWSEAAATPGRLMLAPAFRELFSSEALAPGVELAVGRVGLLFTDLAGSTALYERVGEARAFRLVSEHFAILRRAIEAHHGVVVKTIGDAVMAAFPDGRAALAAALAIQREIRGLESGGLVDPARLVKVGINAGACFAVTLNGQLDYFGTAVNLAARAQHEASGGQIVLTGQAHEEASDLLREAGLRAEAFEVALRGISGAVRLYRVGCAAASA